MSFLQEGFRYDLGKKFRLGVQGAEGDIDVPLLPELSGLQRLEEMTVPHQPAAGNGGATPGSMSDELGPPGLSRNVRPHRAHVCYHKPRFGDWADRLRCCCRSIRTYCIWDIRYSRASTLAWHEQMAGRRVEIRVWLRCVRRWFADHGGGHAGSEPTASARAVCWACPLAFCQRRGFSCYRAGGRFDSQRKKTMTWSNEQR
jgi:hypothetical protein